MSLKREVGISGAVMMGLGSIVGSGVFVSIGIAAGIAGPAVIVATAIAAALATCNALNSAQLAANHPVSGGAYEYGYRYLNPTLGFSAGWMFLCAKAASAATAALGFSGYLLNAVNQDWRWLVPVALGTVVATTAIVASGIRLSNHANIVVVSITLASLAAFVAAGAPHVSTDRLSFDWQPLSLARASALMFVAFTGYGRIATLGEEVLEPRRTIPRAILATLVISTAIYVAVAVVAVDAAGADKLHQAASSAAAPLEVVSRGFATPVHRLVSIGAMTAMLGVLLNLLLGLSRVLLAMGRRGDMPAITARLVPSVIIVGGLVAALSAAGSVKTTWTFSAFTVLVYYALTNLAALQLNERDRLYGKHWAWIGLPVCLTLAFAIEWQVWIVGMLVLGIGLLWHRTRPKLSPP